LANFDNYAGQDFTVSPDTRSLGVDRVVVRSRIVKISGDATELDYVMKQTPLRWRGDRCARRGFDQPNIQQSIALIGPIVRSAQNLAICWAGPTARPSLANAA
jgi:hypothetical protein